MSAFDALVASVQHPAVLATFGDPVTIEPRAPGLTVNSKDRPDPDRMPATIMGAVTDVPMAVEPRDGRKLPLPHSGASIVCEIDPGALPYAVRRGDVLVHKGRRYTIGPPERQHGGMLDLPLFAAG